MLGDDFSLDITKGAYYRQVVQSRKKIEGLYYSIILLQGLDVISLDESDVIFRLADRFRECMKIVILHLKIRNKS